MASHAARRLVWRMTTRLGRLPGLSFASPRTSAVVLIFTQKAVLDLRIDLVQPLLRALGLLPVCFNLSLELRNAILGSAKLV